MIAVLAVLSFFFITADGQFDICRLNDKYKSVFEDFHQRFQTPVQLLIWSDRIGEDAKKELLSPDSKTGKGSPYFKVEGEMEFAADDKTPLVKKLSLALQKLIAGVESQLRKLSHRAFYGCNALLDKSGEIHRLKVLCLYRPAYAGWQ